MDIQEIESLIRSEWEEFYIDYKTILKILRYSNKEQNKEEKNEENNNINNNLEEKLLDNNEQNDEENKRMDKNVNIVLKKYITQLNLEKNKIQFFDKIIQKNRHHKRFEEIIEQLKYIEKSETIKIFKKQLLQSLKNLHREISNYDIYYIKANINIMNDIIYPEEDKLIDEIKLTNKNEEFQKLKELKNEISSFFEESKEYNAKFLSQIKESFTFYSHQGKEVNNEDNSEDEEDSSNDLSSNNLPNEKRLIKARFKLKLFRISFSIMIILLILLTFIYFFYLNIDIDKDPELRSVFPMYRTYGIICLYLWFIGLNIKTWEDIKVNYRALFTFQLSKNSIIDIWIISSIFSSVLFLSFLLYSITRTKLGIKLGLNSFNIVDILPALIWLLLLLFFFCPFKILNYKGRNNVMKLFSECIASILIPIEFKHIWFMDQLTSLIGPMRDIEYTFCYYSYYVNPFQTRQLYCSTSRVVYLIIAIFPNLFRCLQVGRQMIDNQKVFPYIFNIGKYTFNIIVASFSFLSQFHLVFYYFWLANAFISGCYSSFWDLKMDFGYFESGPDWPLRKKNKFKKKFWVLITIPVDIILRFLWMLSISPEIMSQYIRPEFLALVLYTLEMIRRAIWNFIRVEFEHYELEKMYQISFYEELPLIKLSNGKFKTNENKMLNILDVEKKDRMILELRELFNSLDKDKKEYDKDKETSLNHLIEEKKYEKNVKKILDEYLDKYKKDSQDNML